jgi:5,5'-dehydrodivanillate O-demethylase oxygenase subunit
VGLTAEMNERLCRVAPGTPGGDLMRRYWHPIAATSQLPDSGTMAVRILAEDLVLYRTPNGNLGLVEPHCAHRRAGLVYGIPEETGLRCTYHGWLYDASGQCIEQPYEAFVDPNNRYKDRIRIQAYPVQELGGLIFAYLGPDPVPLLPRWEGFVRPDLKREIGVAIIPCNWLQTVENAGDSSHVVYTHFQFSRYVAGKLGWPDLVRHSKSSGAQGFFSHGGHKTASPYGHGAVIFPYIDAQDDCYQMRVPIDDTHTMHIWYMFFTEHDQEMLGIELADQTDPAKIPYFSVPMPQLDSVGRPQWHSLDGNSDQDLVMWATQGGIMDRTKEHLGLGDENILHMRRLLDQQIGIVEEGGDPINVFRDPTANESLVPAISVTMPPKITPDGRPDRTNAARKYSGVYTEATVRALGEAALAEPTH